MSRCLINCLSCGKYYGKSYEIFISLKKQGYTDDMAADALGYVGNIFECCRGCLIHHYNSTCDGIKFMNDQFTLLRYNKNLSDELPLYSGNLPAANANMYTDTTLCDDGYKFNDLQQLNIPTTISTTTMKH